MGSLLKYLLLALAIVLLVSWALTVSKSCNTPKSVDSTLDKIGANDLGNAINPVDDNDSELEDLYEVEESDVKDGNADSSSDDEDLPDYASAADDLDMGDANDPDQDAVDEDTETSSNSSSTAVNTRPGTSGVSGGTTFGKYLVVTGSYLSEANAKIMAKKLRNMGYDGAEVISFDLSQYYSVTTGRYNDLGEARTIARKVKAKVGEAYVHKMRGKKMNR